MNWDNLALTIAGQRTATQAVINFLSSGGAADSIFAANSSLMLNTTKAAMVKAVDKARDSNLNGDIMDAVFRSALLRDMRYCLAGGKFMRVMSCNENLSRIVQTAAQHST